MKRTVLIADDEFLKVMTLGQHLRQAGMEILTAHDGEHALAQIQKQQVDALITDVRMPGMDGISLVERCKSIAPHMPVLVMTGYATVQDAVRAMQAGAMDYLVKPISGEEVVLRLERAFDLMAMRHENLKLKDELKRLKGGQNIVCVSPPMLAILDHLKRAAETDATVLLTGETGTGKEVCSNYLHNLSGRKNGPFVPVSCAALAPGVVESELFGHEKGAFTGAIGRRDGRLQAAHKGTLFLDDIDDVPLDVQAKLLRVIEGAAFERVGGSTKIQVDIRIIAATKRNLSDLVREGRFREDLMYRLSVVQVDIPPLRERPEDIPLLAEYFLQKSLDEMGRPPKQFQADTLAKLRQFCWPGNVRQLKHMVESIVALHVGAEIGVKDLPTWLSHAAELQPPVNFNLPNGGPIDFKQAMTEFEQALLNWAYKKADQNQGLAAQMLNIPRSTFQYRWTQLFKK